MRAACERHRRLCVNVATGDSALQPTCAKDSGASACCIVGVSGRRRASGDYAKDSDAGARVQKLETELFVGLLGGALAALALVGELRQALLQAALDGRLPVRVRC